MIGRHLSVPYVTVESRVMTYDNVTSDYTFYRRPKLQKRRRETDHFTSDTIYGCVSCRAVIRDRFYKRIEFIYDMTVDNLDKTYRACTGSFRSERLEIESGESF